MTRNLSKPPQWEQPTPMALKKMVRALILRNPSRHNQSTWVSNAFEDEETSEGSYPVDRIRALLRQRRSVPDQPLSQDGLCGTKACVAGWAGILGSPPGTFLKQGRAIWDVSLVLPDGTDEDIEPAAMKLLGMNSSQADWLFESNRTRKEVLDGLKALIEDPDAQLSED